MLANVSKKEKFAKEFLYYAAYERICVKYFLSYEYRNIAMRDFRQYVQYERAL